MNVSIIIPAYNAAGTLAETLESLLAQSEPGWEALVVDDGSRDATAKVAKAFGKRDARIKLLTQRNGGEAAARNAGIAAAKHDWLLFLDSDDWIAPHYLERMTAELEAHAELDAVHCGWARVAPDGTQVVESYQAPTGDMFAVWARRSAFPVHACIVRKSLVDDVGRFDTSLKKSPDWDLWQRVSRTGARFGAVRELLAYYRMRPNAASLEAHQMLKDGMRVLRQGHRPDPRVPHPHPDHASGEPPEGILTQEFYLLSWCAGLLLGTGEDARPLLEAIGDDRYPELYPEAVAQCLFEAAPLPGCGPPGIWEQLWPGIQQRVDEFLEALEAQSQSPDLARRARTALTGMILGGSPTWRPLFEEREQTIARQGATIEQLEQARRQAEEERRTGERQRAGLEERLRAQETRMVELEQTKAQLQREKEDAQRLSEERAQMIASHAARIAELERELKETQRQSEERAQAITAQAARIAELERELKETQRQSEARAQTIAAQAARIAELEQGQARLQRELQESQRLGEERGQTIAELEQRAALLERERAEWQRLSETRGAELAELRARLAALEQELTRVGQEREEWQRVVHEHERTMAHREEEAWVRLGLRLRLLKPLAPGPAPAYQPDPLREQRWRLSLAGESMANLVFPPHDPELVRIAIAKAAGRTPWDIQLNQPGVRVESGGRYAVHFAARADRTRNIMVGVAQAQAPWSGIGLYRAVTLTRDWQTFQEEFVATADDDNARVHFDLGGGRAAVELSAVSLHRLADTRTE